MRDITQLPEKDFFQWIKMQLENREFMSGRYYKKEEIRDELYEILFNEQSLTTEEIEYFFIPFGQSGYLTPKIKFEIMLYVLGKDYGRSDLFFEGIGNCNILTGEDIDAIYLQWLLEERLFLSEEEKKEFFIQCLMDNLGLGVLEVLGRAAKDGILVGDLCPVLYEQERIEERIAVRVDGTVIRLPFLAVEDKEELIRIIKCAVAMENKGELTSIDPILDFVKEDGTCVTAVRPPAGKDWGIRILYGAARKEGVEWRK